MAREPGERRERILASAAGLFARKGVSATTVREIADEVGMLSGSLYHHFDSKESMVDEILRGFQDDLFGRYHEIVDELLDSFQRSLWEEYDAIEASDRSPREKLEAVVRASFDAIDHNHSEVAIFQTDAAYLASFDRFAYLEERNIRFRDLWTGLLTQGVASGELRSDLNVELVYRFLRDTVWVAVRWYRPGGDLSPAQVADQYLHILLDGIATTGG